MARRETHSEDFPVAQPPEIDASDLDTDIRRDILIADPELLAQNAKRAYLDQLAFNEEFLTIYLYRGQDEFSPNSHTFGVNGKTVTVDVEKPTLVRRKYVEIIARSQPFKVRTNVIKPQGGNENEAIKNLWQRHKSAQYPFTVIEDKNPRGRAWLESVKREG